MAEFLLEVYVATDTGADADALARRARTAADGLSAEGRPVRCLRSILVAEEETCFLLFEAGAADDVREAVVRAQLPGARVCGAATDHAGDEPEPDALPINELGKWLNVKRRWGPFTPTQLTLFISLLAALLVLPTVAVEWLTTTAAGAGVTVFTDTNGTIAFPFGIVKGPDGAMWFANSQNNSIGRIDTDGTVTNYSDSTVSHPRDITVGHDGALWFTNWGNDTIGRITTSFTIGNYQDEGGGISAPDGIAAGPDGNMWFTNQGNDSIGRITASGAVTDFIDTSISLPYGITAGPDGNLWFTNLNNNSIGRITTSGAVTNFTDDNISGPLRITPGPDGALWFTNNDGSSIGRISTSGAVTTFTGETIANPWYIVTGSDGALWFTSGGNNSIGRITTSGMITSYTNPGINGPIGIAARGGALWFTNPGSNSIGRITTDTAGSCGFGCTDAVAKPGVTVSSATGLPTDEHPTKQTITLPVQARARPVRVRLDSLTPGPTTSAADRQLCPTSGTSRCSGQISVIAGDFSKYVDRTHPIKIQVIAKWQTKVPRSRLMMTKDTGGPPIHLAACVLRKGRYNTPCAQPEKVSGSAAWHNLITTDTVLFVGNDPHLGRRQSNVPDAPTSVKATAGTKQATVQWVKPVVTNGALTGYVITPHRGKTALPPVSVGPGATKAAVKKLASRTAYTFTVAAKNAHGLSYQSLPTKPIKPS